ncbi:major facilitator superfamily protein [Teratosphaeria destructans]|uniref:Major facilitator superfamily protein n=1 Tax=Teratosphaeria destructans TaxID=418781 RepID=A0A9W7SNZ2_9PEZI|nr:major facilitator superfamily protein [Teratosphaeria destructans]
MARLTIPKHTQDITRPILHHLNGDTSWLLQIPRPKEENRAFYNLLIDPWFTGPQIEGAAFLHSQRHVDPSAVQTIAELEDFLEATEREARGSVQRTPTLIDAVAISLAVTDHAHQGTLRQIDPNVPCFALERSTRLVASYGHFRSVTTIPFWLSGPSWRDTSVSVFSGGRDVRLAGVRQQPEDTAMLRLGFIVTLGGLDGSHGQTEAVAYIPHGIPAPHLTHLATASPKLTFVALLQAWHHEKFGITPGYPWPFGWLLGRFLHLDVVLGADDVLQAQELLQARYLIATHDEVKESKGLTSHFLERKEMSPADAIKDGRFDGSAVEAVVLQSGEHKVLTV